MRIVYITYITYIAILYIFTWVADKITYYPQWTWPKWVVPYRLWMCSHNFEHPMSMWKMGGHGLIPWLVCLCIVSFILRFSLKLPDALRNWNGCVTCRKRVDSPKFSKSSKVVLPCVATPMLSPQHVPPFHPGSTVFFGVTAGKLFGQQRGEREPQRSVADPPLERNPQRRRWRRRRSANVWKRKHRKKRTYTLQ